MRRDAKVAPDKPCEHCGKLFGRKRSPNGELETFGKFQRQRFCSPNCARFTTTKRPTRLDPEADDKLCIKCNERKPWDKFFNQKRRRDGKHPWCKACCLTDTRTRNESAPRTYNETHTCARPGCTNKTYTPWATYCSRRCKSLVYVKARCREQKEEAIRLTGGRCKNCGYKKNIAVLNFHHRDPQKKEITIGRHNVAWERTLRELKKCDLLCANCHREVHAEWDLSSYESPGSQWRRRRKEDMVNYLGGKCQGCGYKKTLAALTFHHRDPATKDFEVSQKKYTWERTARELDKCDLLCFNCHTEIHNQNRMLL